MPPFAVMGVVNVTPDSFSDGGRFLEVDRAVDHGRALAAAGAALVDVGGESTRPGSDPVPAPVERDRVVPVVAALAAAGVVVSVDTMKSEVAAAALDNGASLVNDVSSGRHDPGMLPTIADRGAGVVLMHMQGEPRTMQQDPRYGDVVAEVAAFLAERVQAARAAGVDPGSVLVDPGIGFGKTIRHNLDLLAAIGEIGRVASAPVLVGASRKSFLGRLSGVADPSARDDATLATTVWSLRAGARAVRVHDVATTVRAVRFLDVVARATPEGVAA
jgi:dihydropteroate synthase